MDLWDSPFISYVVQKTFAITRVSALWSDGKSKYSSKCWIWAILFFSALLINFLRKTEQKGLYSLTQTKTFLIIRKKEKAVLAWNICYQKAITTRQICIPILIFPTANCLRKKLSDITRNINYLSWLKLTHWIQELFGRTTSRWIH